MFHINAVFIGICFTVLILLMAGAVHVAGWEAAFKLAFILVGGAVALGLIGLAVYGLGLAGMGLIGLIFAIPIFLFDMVKSGVTALFRRG